MAAASHPAKPPRPRAPRPRTLQIPARDRNGAAAGAFDWRPGEMVIGRPKGQRGKTWEAELA